MVQVNPPATNIHGQYPADIRRLFINVNWAEGMRMWVIITGQHCRARSALVEAVPFLLAGIGKGK
jgi:hypothetical protein